MDRKGSDQQMAEIFFAAVKPVLEKDLSRL
jgi:hypothetical protein